MKHIVALLLLLLVLAGCAPAVPETTEPTQPPTLDTTETTEPPLHTLYQPDSPVQTQTAGAVRQYAVPDGQCQLLLPLGDGILVVSTKAAGEETEMILTVISGQEAAVTASKHLYTDLQSFLATLQPLPQGLGYYDSTKGCAVILDSRLQELGRYSLPADMQGLPVLSDMGNAVYYTNGSQLRALELQTGVPRLLREYTYPELLPERVFGGDALLSCSITEADGSSYTAFVSAKNGQILGTDSTLYTLQGTREAFFLHRKEASVTEYLFGELEEPVQSFFPAEENAVCYWLPEQSRMLTVFAESDHVQVLDLYDLTTGLRTASLPLEDIGYIFAAAPAGDGIWLLGRDIALESDVLYFWDGSSQLTQEQTRYVTLRYTEDNPDVQGLALCRKWADKLEQTYDVEITFETEQLVQPPDYQLWGEYHVRAIRSGLAQLEVALSAFPEGFLEELGEISETEVLYLSLVREISDDVLGLQYWQENEAYIALTLGEELQTTFYHEICHALDSYIFSNSTVLDDWDDLNPRGFDYLYSYDGYHEYEDSAYLSGEKRAFTDAYAMTYPMEDRARILEYAMSADNESYFTAPIMQRKLKRLCTAIRDAFDLEESPVAFLWEQYLAQPLAA